MASGATAQRVNTGVLAAAERRVLIWLAHRIPAPINSDHLTALGVAAMAMAALAFRAARDEPLALLVVVFALALNWFGDSLDGTLARVRGHERPRYGFYVDHVLDMVGTAMLLAGLGWSGFMSPLVAAGLLAAYVMTAGEVFLATAVLKTFRMSFLSFGPTELRIVLAVGTLALFRWSVIAPLGMGPFLLFDVGGAVAIVGLLTAFLVSALRNARQLYLEEPRPA
jgi:phosphatidylglycerophosphate synthase